MSEAGRVRTERELWVVHIDPESFQHATLREVTDRLFPASPADAVWRFRELTDKLKYEVAVAVNRWKQQLLDFLGLAELPREQDQWYGDLVPDAAAKQFVLLYFCEKMVSDRVAPYDQESAPYMPKWKEFCKGVYPFGVVWHVEVSPEEINKVEPLKLLDFVHPVYPLSMRSSKELYEVMGPSRERIIQDICRTMKAFQASPLREEMRENLKKWEEYCKRLVETA